METMSRTSSPAGFAIESVNPEAAVYRYDLDSDTLMVHFYGLGIPGVSVPNDDGWYLRWDSHLTRPIGIQLEGFLARAVIDDPSLLDALIIADLRGITVEEIAGIRRSAGLPAIPEEPVAVPDLLRRLWRFATAAPVSLGRHTD